MIVTEQQTTNQKDIMNKPDNCRTAHTSSLETPMVVTAENYRYHYQAAYGLAQPLVMWSEPHGGISGYAAGTHDGMRDGDFGGAAARGYTRYYANLDEFIAAGNPDPRAPVATAMTLSERLAAARRAA